MTSSFILRPGNAVAQTEHLTPVKWSVATELPAPVGMQKQLGLAGVFTGVSHGVLMIAGGSNFADGAMPWQGGKKLHYNDIYVLEKGKDNAFTWLKPSTSHLKQKTAYGASTTIAEGIVCAGGETDSAASSAQAFIMKWDAAKQEITITDLPDLPIPLANACMSSIGRMVYLIGGESEGKPSAQCFTLNMNDKDAQWQAMPPLPIAMSHSVAVTQSNGKHACIYVIGGRSGTASGISVLHNYTFCYDPAYKKWIRLASVGDSKEVTNISAATGVAHGSHDILLIGGDKGNVFHQIEAYNALIAKAKTAEEKQRYQNEKLALLNNHKGFSKDVYKYNTLTCTWKKVGELPFYGQVTTTAVKWNNEIFIPGGEIKPGIRTAAVTRGKFSTK